MLDEAFAGIIYLQIQTVTEHALSVTVRWGEGTYPVSFLTRQKAVNG
jgi:hypothetical protein